MSTAQAKFDELASRINSHVGTIREEGTENQREIFNEMMAYLPELHVLWNNTTDEELGLLFDRFPQFYHYCSIVEELSISEHAKESREYDGLDRFSEQQQGIMKALLTNSAHIEKALLDFKVGKQSFHIVAYSSLCDDVIKWKKETVEFIKQLEADEFHEYGIKTCNILITETYKKLESLINETKERFSSTD